MENTIAKIVGVLVLPIIVWGCKGDAGPAGPLGPHLAGDLYGAVVLFDEDSISIFDHSRVNISIDGTSSSTTSDRDGWWRLVGLRTGTYTITFSKIGYETYKRFSYQFVGGDSVFYGWVNLVNVARYYVDSLSASLFRWESIHTRNNFLSPSPDWCLVVCCHFL